MNIKEVEQLTGLSARQIREYEKQGLLKSINRTESGYRDFDQSHINRLQFIKHARDVGFSIAQIQALLNLRDNDKRSNADVKHLTQQHIEDLSEKIARLQDMKSTLQTWHDSCLGDGSAQCSILDGLTTGNSLEGHPCHHQNKS